MDISIIIPTLNEEGQIAATLDAVKKRAAQPEALEIIVADGNSNDRTCQQAQERDARIITVTQRRRSVQMNQGALAAQAEIFYFLHADTHPPDKFDTHIRNALQSGYDAGCFQLTFDEDTPLLNFYSWCTRLDLDVFRFGDQSLFMHRRVFEQTGGFRRDYHLLEDQEMVRHIKRYFRFKILPQQVVTSARKYEQHGPLKLQLKYAFLLLMHRLGFAQQKLQKIYKNWLSAQ